MVKAGIVFFIVWCLNLVMSHASAQTVMITDDPDYTEGESSALLELHSISGGLLLPRLSGAQREALAEPATGLIVYQVDDSPGLYYNEGTPQDPQWLRLTTNETGAPQEAAGNVWDVDGNIYPSRVIGDTEWMLENLRTTHYSDGTRILNLALSSDWAQDSEGAHVAYDKKEANAHTYGLLYNGYAVANPAGICPAGWIVPGEDHWLALAGHLGGTDHAAIALKAARYWDDPDGQATNSSAFTALPGGLREADSGQFIQLKYQAGWWTSTSQGPKSARSMHLYSGSHELYQEYSDLGQGLSLRCIRILSHTGSRR